MADSQYRFRAWHGQHKQMIFREIFDRNWYTKRNKVYAPIHPDDRYDYKLMQYTGLKDRNGQEVFEGDVIKMIALHNDHHQKGAVDYASIYFSHGQFCIALDGYKIGTPLFNVKLSSSVEVIGNIHENPELLK